MTILVTGATGLVGGETVRRLADRGVSVRALTRDARASRASWLTAMPSVELAEGDMAHRDSLEGALRGVDCAMLISSSDPAMAEVQLNFIEAARRASVERVVKLSGIIPALDSPFRFARMHAEIEQRLATSGLAYTNLRAGEFMHAYFRQVPSIVAAGELRLPMGDARIASVDIGDIAEVAADVLTSDGHDGQTYPLTGPDALSMSEVASALSAATGRPIRYVNVDPEQAKRGQLAAGVPSYTVDALAELFAERRLGKEAHVSRVIETTFGRRPISFQQFAERNAAIFRGNEPAPLA